MNHTFGSLGFPTNVQNTLRSAGITSVEDLVLCTATEIQNAFKFSSEEMGQVIFCLIKARLSLWSDAPPDISTSIKIIQSLISGIDPDSGSKLPQDHILKREDVVQTLSHALEVFQGIKRAKTPANAGKVWTKEEDDILDTGYTAGTPIEEIADRLQRSESATWARLDWLGVIKEDDEHKVPQYKARI